MLLLVFPLLLLSSFVSSQTIIKNLPGFEGDLPFKLETGYIGVGDFEDVQLFYYFIESEGRPKDDPLFLWLTGGPGCSALSGLVFEIGPIQFDYSNSSGNRPVFKSNPYSWTKVASIIFLDSPVGTGFSYSNSWRGYEVSDTLAAAQAYEFLIKWLMLHPQFRSNPLYITGDSYSGVVVPIIVKEISNGNDERKPPLNLKGYVLGNPVTCEEMDLNNRVPYAQMTGLISDKLYEAAKRDCKGEYMNVDPNNAACRVDLLNISTCLAQIPLNHILEPICNFISPRDEELEWKRRDEELEWKRSLLEEEYKSNVLSTLKEAELAFWCRSYNYEYVYIWANDKTVQKALNIREGTKGDWDRCNKSLAYTKDVKCSWDYHRNLTRKPYRALIYSGDHDLAIPYIGTYKWIQALNLSILAADWTPWYVDGQIAGYDTLYTSKKKFDLTFTTIRGGGHTAPEYKPKECLAMIQRWLAYYPL